MLGIGVIAPHTLDQISGNLSTDRLIGNLSVDRITGLTEEMTKIAAQGIKLYKLDIKSANWSLSGLSQGQTGLEGCWHFYRYNSLATTPTLANCNAASYTAERYYADSALSISLNYSDSYTAKCVTYLYCDEAKTVNIAFCTDDNGTAYLNGTQITTITSCAWTSSIACNFKRGWNELIVIYTEGSGGDGWTTSPKLYNNSAFRYMCADLGGVYTQTITATPIGHTVPLNSNMVLSNLMYVPGTDANTNEVSKYEIEGLNKGMCIPNSNGTVTVRSIGNYPNMNLTCYVLAKEYK